MRLSFSLASSKEKATRSSNVDRHFLVQLIALARSMSFIEIYLILPESHRVPPLFYRIPPLFYRIPLLFYRILRLSYRIPPPLAVLPPLVAPFDIKGITG